MKKLLLRDDGAAVTRIILLSEGVRLEIFEVLLERSPISNYDFPRRILNQALKMIPDILEDREISVIFSRNFMNLLPFLVDLASKKQWEQFIDLILTQPDDGKSSSIWYKYLSGYEHHRFQFRLHLWKRTQRKMGHYIQHYIRRFIAGRRRIW